MVTRVGILSYGNLEGDIEHTVRHSPGTELEAVLTRGNSDNLSISAEGAKVCRAEGVLSMKDQIDVIILCGGSAMDPPGQTPGIAARFNVIGSFSIHVNIPRYSETVDRAAKEDGHVGIIPVGWDPGMFPFNRPYVSAILPGGSDYIFWGRDVSQDHFDAIRRIKDVKDVRQYTTSAEVVLTAVKSKKAPKPTTRDKHTRECFVVAEEGTDLRAIEEAVVTMPNYFADYGTMVHFTSRGELMRDCVGIPHDGFVARIDNTGWNDENGHVIEYSLELDSSPKSTVSVIAAYVRVVYRPSREGQFGCRTVLDIIPAYLSAADGVGLREHLL